MRLKLLLFSLWLLVSGVPDTGATFTGADAGRGTLTVVIEDHANQMTQITVLDPETGAETPLVSVPGAGNHIMDYAWSLDGQKLAYTIRAETTGQLWLLRDGETRMLASDVSTSSGGKPVWHPDGQTLTYLKTEVVAGNFVGFAVRLDLDSPDESGLLLDTVVSETPVWSPDGTRLAWVTLDADYRNSLYVGDAGGSNAERLIGGMGKLGALDWSPDGTSLALVANETPHLFAERLMIISLDDRVPHPLTPPGWIAEPKWSPDGTHIAFKSTVDELTPDRDINPELFVINADGTDLRPLTTFKPMEMHTFAWSPDGMQIAVSVVFGQRIGMDIFNATLYLVDTSTGEVRVLLDTPRNELNPLWHAAPDPVPETGSE